MNEEELATMVAYLGVMQKDGKFSMDEKHHILFLQRSALTVMHQYHIQPRHFSGSLSTTDMQKVQNLLAKMRRDEKFSIEDKTHVLYLQRANSKLLS
jgi:CRISPR/Cas system-associated endoribonuclease Cas2